MREQTKPNSIKAVIFDFDGTIADSFLVFIETFEEIMRRPRPLTEKQIAGFRTLPLSEIIDELGVKKWRVPKLVIKGRHEMAKKIDRVNAFAGMPEALRELSANYKLYILSSNDKAAIAAFLDNNNIKNISGIYAGISLSGKAHQLKNLQKRESLLASECLYVGDEIRDIEAAKKTHTKCLAVGWGFSDPASLKAYSPDGTAAKPQDLVKAIDKLGQPG